MNRSVISLAGLAVVTIASPGCELNVCPPGATQICYCSGSSGAQTCADDGSEWEPCHCGADSEQCGDGVCEGSESCETCGADCGQCTAGQCGAANFSVSCGTFTCPQHSVCGINGCDCQSGYVEQSCSGQPCTAGTCAPPNWWCAPDGGTSVCGDGICDPGESCSADCGTTQDAVILPVPPVPQLTQVWCWAATSEMVLTYFGKAGAQCDIVSFWTQLPCCPYGNGVSGCYVGAPTVQAIANAIQLGGVSAQVVNSALTYQEVVQEISANHPIIIAYQGSFAGHVVVLHGFDSQSNVYIHDPMYGTFVVPYAVSGLYNGAAYWSQSIITGL